MFCREQIVNNKRVKLLLRDDIDESVVNEIFKFCEYRSVQEIIKLACEGVVIDVGAHAGYFTLWVAMQNPKIKIYALEPIKQNFILFKKNLEANKIKNVVAKNFALYKKTGEVNIFLSKNSHNHSFLPISNKIKKVKTISLTDLIKNNKIEKILLLKLDIEGGEYEIFENLNEKIFTKIKNIFLEFHQIKNKNYKIIENILRKNGFSVEIFPSHFDKNMGFLFARNKRLKK